MGQTQPQKNETPESLWRLSCALFIDFLETFVHPDLRKYLSNLDPYNSGMTTLKWYFWVGL
jgi:hypothetical protein